MIVSPMPRIMQLTLTSSSAFGDGNHPTTQGMMRMLHEFAQEHDGDVRRILDMGCGSGILCILAAQLLPEAKILAADIVAADGATGTILDDALTIACGEGAIRPTLIQRAGKPAMPTEELLRGKPIPAGTQL